MYSSLRDLQMIKIFISHQHKEYKRGNIKLENELKASVKLILEIFNEIIAFFVQQIFHMNELQECCLPVFVNFKPIFHKWALELKSPMKF